MATDSHFIFTVRSAGKGSDCPLLNRLFKVTAPFQPPGTRRELGEYSLAGILDKLGGEPGYVRIVHSPMKYDQPIDVYMHRKDASFVPVQRMLPLQSGGEICSDAHKRLIVPANQGGDGAGGGGGDTNTDNSGEANKTLTFANVSREYGHNCVDQRNLASFSAEVDSVTCLGMKLWGAERGDLSFNDQSCARACRPVNVITMGPATVYVPAAMNLKNALNEQHPNSCDWATPVKPVGVALPCFCVREGDFRSASAGGCLAKFEESHANINMVVTLVLLLEYVCKNGVFGGEKTGFRTPVKGQAQHLVALREGTKLRRQATAKRLASRPHAARSAYNYFTAEMKTRYAAINPKTWHKTALAEWKVLGELAKTTKSRSGLVKWDKLARADKARFAEDLTSGTAQGPKGKVRGVSQGKGKGPGKAKSGHKVRTMDDGESDEDDNNIETDDEADGETNQPQMERGQRVEVEFEDDDAAAGGKSWFNGVVEEQTATGTIIAFDDGDVEDLNLKIIRFNLLIGH
jgi:hypothetical protein